MVIVWIQHQISDLVAFESKAVVERNVQQLFHSFFVIKLITIVALHGVVGIGSCPYNIFPMEIVKVFSCESGQFAYFFDGFVLLHIDTLSFLSISRSRGTLQDGGRVHPASRRWLAVQWIVSAVV